ncbi:hypothetical protein GF327_06645 [Candidatus Woesearchaeota archaeon]|nr:hypothetical protein [Candidatus Woesearchaeota archaeon]
MSQDETLEQKIKTVLDFAFSREPGSGSYTARQYLEQVEREIDQVLLSQGMHREMPGNPFYSQVREIRRAYSHLSGELQDQQDYR